MLMSDAQPARSARFDITTRRWGILAFTAALLVVLWVTRITERPIMWDAAENLQLTLNLARHGAISMSDSSPWGASMFREPIPLFCGAMLIRAEDAVLGRADTATYYQGKRAKLLKYQNVPWVALLGVIIFLLARELGLAFWPSLLCVLLSNLLLFDADIGYFMLDSFYTEAAASALLAMGSLLLMKGIRYDRLTSIVLAALCFGMLSLVKAIFLYIIIGLAVAIPVLSLYLRRSLGRSVTQAALLAVVSALVIVPWMMRNYRDLGQFAVAQRGGEVLYDRAVADQLTRDEYLGSYYLFAPYPLNGALRRILGYTNTDKEEGGRLQRINSLGRAGFTDRDVSAEMNARPQDAFTYFHRAGADRVLLVRQFAAAGNPQPELAADRELQKRAVRMILQHPLRHMALIPVYLWQGAFLIFPSAVFIVIYAFKRRDLPLAVLVSPALLSLLAYAGFAHLEPRYAIPTYPIIICALVALACQYIRPFRREFR
jgi:hypothetical protein